MTCSGGRTSNLSAVRYSINISSKSRAITPYLVKYNEKIRYRFRVGYNTVHTLIDDKICTCIMSVIVLGILELQEWTDGMDPGSDPDLSLFIAVMTLVIGVMTLFIGTMTLIRVWFSG